MAFLAALMVSLQKAEYARSGLEEDGGGRLSIPESTRFVNWFHLALRKFHLFTGLVCIGSIGLTGVISDGLCWDLGKGSRIVRWGEGPLSFANARSGFEVVFHLPEWKLSGCLGSNRSWTPDTEAQSSSAAPSGFVELYPQVVLRQLQSPA